ncbi:hypothetical protein [Rivibacter subsaxonicus]|uniref:hypothetical protein n=1 Tax=Rivibacter subsaxonicus TaxID=457575 RepID=UPI00102AB886|nr:hypothetical protein [Rivibacter subsaxonicus]
MRDVQHVSTDAQGNVEERARYPGGLHQLTLDRSVAKSAVNRANILLSLCAVFMSGCATRVSPEPPQTAVVSGSSSKAQVHLSLDQGIAVQRITALSVHQASAGGRSFVFYRVKQGAPTDIYLIAVENQELRYWGYVDEFNQQPDAELRLALHSILPGLLPPK